MIIINTVDKTVEIVGEVYLGDFMVYVDEFFEDLEDDDIDNYKFIEPMDNLHLN